MASLCLLSEDGATAERWELADKPLAIGRGEAADVVVADATLSRRHFLIVPEAGHYLVQDLDSQNGTFVDGQRAKATRLHHHDCIAAGRTLFIFSDTAAASRVMKRV